MKLFSRLALLGLTVAILSAAYLYGRSYMAERWVTKEVANSSDMLANLPASDYIPLLEHVSNADFNIRDLSNTEHGDFRGMIIIGPEKHVLLSFFNSANIRAGSARTTIVLDRNLEHSLTTTTRTPLRVFRNYLLRREGYYTFLIDGSTSLVSFERHTSNEPATKGMIQELYESSSYYRYDEYALRNMNHARIGYIKAHVFLIDGRWIEVREDTDLNLSLPAKGQDDLSANQTASFLEVRAPDYDDEENSVLLNARNANITLDHFLKETYSEGRGAVIGAPTGGALAPAWSGQAYYTLEIDDKTIKFVWQHNFRVDTYLYASPATDIVLVASKVGRQYVLISTN